VHEYLRTSVNGSYGSFRMKTRERIILEKRILLLFSSWVGYPHVESEQCAEEVSSCTIDLG
jgi:hypothetical protein